MWMFLIGRRRQLKLMLLKVDEIVLRDGFELIIGFVLPQFEDNVIDV